MKFLSDTCMFRKRPKMVRPMNLETCTRVAVRGLECGEKIPVGLAPTMAIYRLWKANSIAERTFMFV